MLCRFVSENTLSVNLKVRFKVAYLALRNTTSDESIDSDVIFEIEFKCSTERSKNKDVECIFCNGKFSEDERGEICIMCSSCSKRALPGLYQS